MSREADAATTRIVAGWPARFESARAPALGLAADADFAAVIRQYVADQPEAVKLPAARKRLGLD